jgi:hypothetical protein
MKHATNLAIALGNIQSLVSDITSSLHAVHDLVGDLADCDAPAYRFGALTRVLANHLEQAYILLGELIHEGREAPVAEEESEGVAL